MRAVQRASSLTEPEFSHAIFASLAALISPFFLWIVEWYLPYPHILEELLKAGLVWSIRSISSLRTKLLIVVGLAILFTVSETVLYSFQFFTLHSLVPLFVRILATGILHSLTLIVMVSASSISPKLFLVGIFCAILLHFAYNLTMLPVFL